MEMEMEMAKPTIQDVLEFLRETDAKDWYLVAEYVRQQNPIRDVRYAALLRVGDKVLFQWNHAAGCDDRLKGTITRIDRRKGRVHLLADFGDGRLTPCGLPATMVMKA